MTTKKSEEKALTVLADRFPALSDMGEMELLSDALGGSDGEGLEIGDLPQMRIPTGGGSYWEIGGDAPVAEVECIVAAVQKARAYWAVSYDDGGGGRTPDCSSSDGEIGVGNPGGRCNGCPMAEFGSDPKGGRGQACKAMVRLILLREHHMLPLLLTIPPSGIKAWRRYALDIVGKKTPIQGVITKIGLEKTQNADGIAYSRPTFTVGDKLDPKQAAALHQQTAIFRGILQASGEPRDDMPPVQEPKNKDIPF